MNENQPAETTPWQRANTDWFRQSRWGVASHYLADTAGCQQATRSNTEDWNRQIDAFDVHGLARQLAEAHVPYYFISLGQNSGFYLSPNRTYDEIVGIVPSKCSRRDLVADLAGALAPCGIRLLVSPPAICRIFLGWQPIPVSLTVPNFTFTPSWGNGGAGGRSAFPMS